MLSNSKPARTIRFLLMIASISFPVAGHAKPESEFSALLKSLVYFGITDASTLNHNLTLYQQILKTVVRDAGIAKRSLNSVQSKFPQNRILKRLYEIQNRLQAQVPYLPYHLATLSMGEAWNAVSDAIEATKKEDYGRVLKVSANAIVILENSRI